MSQQSMVVRVPLTALVLAGAALLGGCAGGGYGGYGGYGGGYYGQPPMDGPMSPREAGRRAQEQSLEDRVMAALRADPRVGAQGITVTSQGGGVVMLGGTPANGVAGRDLALQIARSVWGVRSVANNMVLN